MRKYLLACSNAHYKAAALLFKEYSVGLPIDLSFQHFDIELEHLKKMYSLPEAGIILCKQDSIFIGCVGIRKITHEIAELKRMYVLPSHQRKGIGNELLNHALNFAAKCDYQFVRLDTLSTMEPAINLYKKNGFIQIEAYYNNPIMTAVYLEKRLID
jgi:ribosomal protein S18 acetylase RimI-like enzyme